MLLSHIKRVKITLHTKLIIHDKFHAWVLMLQIEEFLLHVAHYNLDFLYTCFTKLFYLSLNKYLALHTEQSFRTLVGEWCEATRLACGKDDSVVYFPY